VGAAATEDDSFDRRAADAAGLAGAQVNMVVELEESCDTIRIHVVGDRRAAQFDRVGEDFDKSVAQAG
jgi:hypothetical protein